MLSAIGKPFVDGVIWIRQTVASGCRIGSAALRPSCPALLKMPSERHGRRKESEPQDQRKPRWEADLPEPCDPGSIDQLDEPDQDSFLVVLDVPCQAASELSKHLIAHVISHDLLRMTESNVDSATAAFVACDVVLSFGGLTQTVLHRFPWGLAVVFLGASCVRCVTSSRSSRQVR